MRTPHNYRFMHPHPLEVQQAIAIASGEVLGNGTPVRRSTRFLSPTMTVKATRQRKPDRRERQVTLLITVGRPNYYEARRIKASQKSGVCFPMKQSDLQFYPAKTKND